ncbi:hypothetical protein, partial [Lactobacillus delbrueckii]|uniref:hypothetical protein n=1 Tax=Lactobacillus delbrueckii TaxID=1584 RepID=UPI001E5839DB
AILGSFLVSNNGKLDIAQAFRLILMMLWLTKLYQANKGLVLFLLAKLLNFQGTSPRLQVGSLSYLEHCLSI